MLTIAKHPILARVWREECQPRISYPRTLPAKAYFWLGLVLLAALLAQQLAGWHWPLLGELQAGKVYKQLSGFGLLALLLYQWRFSVTRAKGDMRKAFAMVEFHKLFGAVAPLLFFLHSQSLGYAYLKLLSLAFLLVILTGLFNFEIVKTHRPWFRPVWITAHVGLSMLLLFLVAYHVYVGYAFK